ncbi:uncharacterized protein BJ171DRAFT_520209 [Polychytrium aggregatum]|uniref:uncharacterized protein n=1 Tax=Polychytrium aggregatum TaxID=110093 RepID=UPI0022FECA66|nr:uncharacterized protein BJ171DRAFT_520209 [Polychytrium aggregatum]KAI9197412.1 hypothetical protein BJ171DRAFT_520209 [Polychytrium aggregatum]
MIKDWGADAIVQIGDNDYHDDPPAFMEMYESVFGKHIPIFSVVGNHDIAAWYKKKGYRKLFLDNLDRNRLTDSCYGEYGINMVCVWNGMVFVLSGVGTLGTEHARFLDAVLSYYEDVPWKFCVWHKNQNAYQTGDKTDEVGYEVYDICRQHGAIIATSHEHSYERTYIMSDFENKMISSVKPLLRVRPGRSFAFVSGLGGESIRPWYNGNNLNPWWAATAALDNGADYGALLCKFNKKGKNPNQAVCRFEDLDGDVWDHFTMSTDPHGLGPDEDDLQPAKATESTQATEAAKPTAKKQHHIEIPILSPADATTVNPATGHIVCSPHQMNFAVDGTNSADMWHILRFSTEGFLQKGDRIVAAHLQVMGAHAPEALHDVSTSAGPYAAQDLFMSALDDLRMTITSISDKRGRGFGLQSYCQTPAASLRQADIDAMATEGTVRSNRLSKWTRSKVDRIHRHDSVEWMQPKNASEWESGEVWVSPNLQSLVQARLDDIWSKAVAGMDDHEVRDTKLSLMLTGRTFLAPKVQSALEEASAALRSSDFERGVYGIHRELGSCVAPALVVVVERESA